MNVMKKSYMNIKTQVEDCRVLVMTQIEYHWNGWHYSEENKSIGLRYQIYRAPQFEMFLEVHYRVQKQVINYRIPLTTTQFHEGRNKYHFLCPLVINGQVCRNRVGKLYLPPGQKYFGCMECYNLTYQSRQEHDARIDQLLSYPKLMAEKIRKGKLCDLRLVTKALQKYLDTKEIEET